jgi:Fe-S cluster assembly protein SufD
MKEKIIVSDDIKQTYVLKGSQSLDLDFDYIFNKPDTKASILIKAVVFDEAQFSFLGNLVINKGSKNVDTFLDIRCLLIGDKPNVNVVPSLEISENEVRAGHAAAISYLDIDQKGYLMSKGIPSESAEEMLIEAFIG